MQDSLINSSFKYCEDIAKNHYENFPVASFLIPKEKRKYLYSIYAFARAADDFADEPDIEGGKEKRLTLLDEWNSKLEECYNNKAYDPIFIALSSTVKECEIPKEPLENLLKAFRQDVIKGRYNDFSEVLDYCSNSANPVGRLVLMIFGKHDEAVFKFSDKICTALQLTNFWQDVSIDLKKDRIYIPGDDMKKFEYTEDELFKLKYNFNFKELLKFQVERTEKFFEEGRELIRLTGEDENLKKLTWELKLTWLGGMEILNKIKSFDYDVLNNRPKLNFFDKLKLLTASKYLK
jgi:squalene synthase HpnC